MSMLTRTGTSIRKHRRRQSGKRRRGSAPTILLPSSSPLPTAVSLNLDINGKILLTPQGSPSKSVSSTFEKSSQQPSILFEKVELVPGLPTLHEERSFISVTHTSALTRDASYSLIASFQDANTEAEATWEFVEKAFVILNNTRLVTLLCGLLIAFPLAMMTAGGKYLDECPKEPKIPVYLLVGGCFGLLKLIFLLWHQVRRRYHDIDEMMTGTDMGEVITISRMTNVSLTLFLCVWFVLGNYWLFSIWKPRYDPPLHDPQNWCDRHVYLFAFWQIIVCYILIAIFLILCFFFSCCHWLLWCLPSSSDNFC